MLELILSVIITCFFVLMIVFIIVAIIQGIYYIIYQRSNRVHLSFRAYCYMDCSFFSLHYKGKQIDTILIYSKYKCSFYALGLNGICLLYTSGKAPKYINDQWDNSVKNIRWGLLGKTGPNGCGWLSVYNIMVSRCV